jgi:hypothetical protein
MARTSMAQLITFVRDLIFDPSGADSHFTDDQIQEALDLQRRDVANLILAAQDSILQDGQVEWHNFFAPVGMWEDNVLIQGPSWEELTPDTEELLYGRWTFTDPQTRPLRMSGAYYNCYLAAADLLRKWSAAVKLSFSFSTGSMQFSKAQKFRNLSELAEDYCIRGNRILIIDAYRGDMSLGYTHPTYAAFSIDPT